VIVIILLVVAIFAVLVLSHEWGHFMAARRSGVEVEEFGFGFPPRIWGRRFGSTLYSVNALPLGGFVRLKGEDSTTTGPGTFASAPFGKKLGILLAGVGMNALLAYALLVYLCATGLPPVIPGQFSLGTPQYAQPEQVTVVDVARDSPADKAGIRRGDALLAANGSALRTEKDLMDFTRSEAGHEVTITSKRGSLTQDIRLTLRPPELKSGYLGVTPLVTYKLRYGWWSPLVALGLLAQLAWATVMAFAGLVVGLFVHGRVSENVTGPVGITVILSALVQLGLSYVLLMVAQISVSLAVVNVLPLPALDGGRFAVIAYSKLTGRQVSATREAQIHTVGFVALLGLMAVVTFLDIKRLF
jgi:regulator of sigma E protease